MLAFQLMLSVKHGLLCLDFQHGTEGKSSKGKSLKMEDDSAPPRLKTNVEETIVLKVKD